jgi:hypothetical protein
MSNTEPNATTAPVSPRRPRLIIGTELAKMQSPPTPTRWGRWRLKKRYDTLELRGADGYLLYGVDLRDARKSSAACLDWVCQASKKAYLTNDDRADLLQAIRDTVDPQGTLCSGGVERASRKAEAK